MAYLAARGAAPSIGVSRQHAVVTGQIFGLCFRVGPNQ